MNLVIVESPAKTKTIKQFLGKDYNVVATKGHIRDIENTGKDNLGIDFDNGFKPIYSIIKSQYSTIKMLNDAISKSDRVYLATDPDREGEAISWHLNDVLNIDGKIVKRIEFNEITEEAIKNAIQNPRDIDENLFHSQETRKIMDRIIGYKLSNLVKKMVGSSESGTVSAGRVQSACLRIITDREEEIQKFNKKTYYEIEVSFSRYKAKLIDPLKKTTLQFDDIKECEEILKQLDNSFIISSIKEKSRKEYAPAPFNTADLLQQASSKYSFTGKRAAKIAHELYEGIEVNGKHMALITYTRTDSTRLSNQFIGQLVGYIINNVGKEYLGYTHSKKSHETDQNSHEAIRPVSMYNTPESMKEYLTKEQYKIYTLIYNRTLECNLKDAELKDTIVEFTNSGYTFSTTFTKTIFPGFKINRKNESSEEIEFNGELGTVKTIKKLPEILTKVTKGPERFSESSIIGEMEKSGIGRPSTYPTTIEILKKRKFIEIVDKKIVPTEDGLLTSLFLQKYFDNIINVKYTAEMEHLLDKIALGEKSEEDVAPKFYNSFIKTLKKVDISALETGEVCPKCGSKMVYKVSKTGRFEACSNYPTCTYIKKAEPKEESFIPCPECGVGHLVLRTATKGKSKGKQFYGCSNYPKCKCVLTTLPIKK